MIKATIYLNDIPYSGIDYEAPEDLTTPVPAFRSGFSPGGLGSGRDVLKWGGAPYLIQGRRNILSHLTRIIERMQDDNLDVGTLRVEIAHKAFPTN